MRPLTAHRPRVPRSGQVCGARPAAGTAASSPAPRDAACSSTSLANRTFRHWSLLPAVLLFVALTLYPLAQSRADERLDDRVRARAPTIWTLHAAAQLRSAARRRRARGRRSSTRCVFVVVSVAIEMVHRPGARARRRRDDARQGAGCARCMILPILVPPVAIGSMWKLMYNYDFGIFNQALTALGLRAGQLARLDAASRCCRSSSSTSGTGCRSCS